VKIQENVRFKGTALSLVVEDNQKQISLVQFKAHSEFTEWNIGELLEQICAPLTDIPPDENAIENDSMNH
jgi:hypothetical protein